MRCFAFIGMLFLVTSTNAQGVSLCDSFAYTLRYEPIADYVKSCEVRKTLRRFFVESTEGHLKLLEAGYLGSSAYLQDIRSKYVINRGGYAGFLVLRIEFSAAALDEPLYLTVDSHSVSQGLRQSFKLQNSGIVVSSLGEVLLVDLCESSPVVGDVTLSIGYIPTLTVEKCDLFVGDEVKRIIGVVASE